MPDTTRHPVLVIDDEIGPRESLRILLKKEFEVLCADSVDEGLRLLKERAPRVIVLDIRMPGKNGIEGLREIRNIDRHVSVIMLTGFGALETAQEALRLGANDYIKKPFDAKEMLLVIRHHAQRTLVQRRREKAEKELKGLNERLMQELAQKEQMANLGQASAEFLHDLRNPLTIVLGYVQLLSEQLISAKEVLGGEYGETVEYLDVIERNVQRCNELAQMWQTYGKGNIEKREPTPVGPLLTDIVTGVQPLVSGQQAEIECNLDAGAAQVMGSRAQLLRAVHNVVANAVQAVPNGDGRITVRCDRVRDHVLIEVEDNGCGMDEEQLKKVFDAYYTTKDEDKGTGLGLYITKKIIEEHGGTISMNSEPDKGTKVDIRLPAYDEKGSAARATA